MYDVNFGYIREQRENTNQIYNCVSNNNFINGSNKTRTWHKRHGYGGNEHKVSSGTVFYKQIDVLLEIWV